MGREKLSASALRRSGAKRDDASGRRFAKVRRIPLAEDRMTQEPTIAFAATTADLDGVSAMMRRYLQWDLEEFERLSGIRLRVDAYLANIIDHIEDYLPPYRRLATARAADGALRGMAAAQAAPT
jgi:hypothetical protein